MREGGRGTDVPDSWDDGGREEACQHDEGRHHLRVVQRTEQLRHRVTETFLQCLLHLIIGALHEGELLR